MQNGNKNTKNRCMTSFNKFCVCLYKIYKRHYDSQI